MTEKKRLTLSKRVPTRTKTVTAIWCNKKYSKMSEQFRAIRARTRNPSDTCYWCRHPFENGEMVALACFEKKGNKVLCQDCADELLRGGPE